MEYPRLLIAVITPNVLMNLGLKSILERIVPVADVYTFTSVAEMQGSGERFYHYFVSAQILLENNSVLLGGGCRPIVLTDSEAPIANLAGVPHLNINQSEEMLVRNILRLHQGAHPNGRHPHAGGDVEAMAHSAAVPAQHATSDRAEEVLSAREIDVLRLIVRGMLNKEIADTLNIGITTVISHRRNIVEKLGTRSVSAMTIYAVMRGYISINDI